MPALFSSRVWLWLALAAVLVLAVALRIIPLDQRDYWYDEAFTGITVQQSWGDMMDIIISDVHPPFYYMVLKVWAMVVGSGPLALRMFSVACGTATVGLVFVAVRAMVPRTPFPALAAALVAAINPFLVNYSQEARMYALLGFLLLLTAVLLLRSWQWPTFGRRVAYSVVVLLSVLTHNLAFLFAVVFFVADAWHAVRTRPMPFGRWFVSGYGIPIIGFTLWFPFFLMQMVTHGTLGWVPAAPLMAMVTTLHVFLFGSPVGVIGVPPPLGYRVPLLTIAIVSTALVCGVVALGVIMTRKKAWDRGLVLMGSLAVFPVLMTWLLQEIDMRLYVERFMIGAAVFLVVFLVAAIGKLSTRALLACTVGYVVLVFLVQPFTHVRVFPTIVDAVEPEVADHTIVFTDAFSFTVGRFYLGEDALLHLRFYNMNDVQQVLTSWATIGDGQQIFMLPDEPHYVVTTRPELFPGYHVVTTADAYTVLTR